MWSHVAYLSVSTFTNDLLQKRIVTRSAHVKHKSSISSCSIVTTIIKYVTLPDRSHQVNKMCMGNTNAQWQQVQNGYFEYKVMVKVKKVIDHGAI